MINIKKMNNSLLVSMPPLLLSTFITFFCSIINAEIMGFTAGEILILLIFVAVDFLTGVSSSLIKDEKITSKKGLKTVFKLVTYTMTILLFAVVESMTVKNGGIGFASLTIAFLRNFVFCLMLFWEFHSVGENIEKVFGDKPKIFYFVELTVNLLEKKLKGLIESSLKKSKNEKSDNQESS
jgi:phage-related holin